MFLVRAELEQVLEKQIGWVWYLSLT